MNKRANHPFVVWGTCFLWLTSLFSILWSLLLFFCVGEVLLMTGTDLVNALVLLSGIIMLPTNVHMLYSIANGKKIDYQSKVVCCPLWLCIVWIIVINVIGVVLCIERIHSCHITTESTISNGMQQYRSEPKYKHFMDNLQWSLKCCGLLSYKDWFTYDWYDKIRDFEWDPASRKRDSPSTKQNPETDSVPLSCCKSGSCISNYLTELGTYSINTKGCKDTMYTIILLSMNAHMVLFILIIVFEVLILKLIMIKEREECVNSCDMNVRHLMSVNDNFEVSSGSCQEQPEDTSDDDVHRGRHEDRE